MSYVIAGHPRFQEWCCGSRSAGSMLWALEPSECIEEAGSRRDGSECIEEAGSRRGGCLSIEGDTR